MTNKEAITQLTYIINDYEKVRDKLIGHAISYPIDENDIDALKMAIKALKKGGD